MILRTSILCLLSSAALASPLGRMPVQGWLGDGGGDALVGGHDLGFELSTNADGTGVVWSEVQTLDVFNGSFTAYLGTEADLDLALFADYTTLYLSVSVDGGPPLDPFAIEHTARAAFSEHAASAETLDGFTADDFLSSSYAPSWNDLTDIPPDVADGGGATYSAGFGMALVGTRFSISEPTIESIAAGTCYDDVVELTDALDGVYGTDTSADNETVTGVSLTGAVLAVDEAGTTHTTSLAGLPGLWDVSGTSLVYEDGRVGINTSTPNGTLEVDGTLVMRTPSGNAAIRLSPASTGYDERPELVLQSAATSSGTNSSFHISRNLVFDNVDDDYFFIDPLQPGSTLEFDADGAFAFTHADEGDGSPAVREDLLRIDATGEVSARVLIAGDNLQRTDSDFPAVGGGINHVLDGDYASIGGGRGHFLEFDDSTIAGGKDNHISANRAVVGGGEGNWANGSDGVVSGGQYNRMASVDTCDDVNVEPIPTNGCFLASDSLDGTTTEYDSYRVCANQCFSPTAGSQHTTISGGRRNHIANNAAHGAVGGGIDNQIDGIPSSVIGGGWLNTIVATSSGGRSVIGGGQANTIAGEFNGTISGGAYNILDDSRGGAIAGGRRNRVTADYSTAAGGLRNEANASYSFVGGRLAIANHTGSFVWGSNHTTPVETTADRQFIARAEGGVYFYSDGDQSSGVALPPGDGAWSSLSDRNAKKNIEAVDVDAVLDHIRGLPLYTWTYKTHDHVVHLGPMAQDFAAAFHLGSSDTRISTVDADGVALAGVQALALRVSEQAEELDGLRDALADRDAELDMMRHRLARLEALVVGAGTP